MPVEVKFFDQFQAATHNLVETATVLQQMLDDGAERQPAIAQIAELESRGDVIVHDITHLLVRTLVTPFSSDDIQHLIDAVDTALDTIHLASERMSIYQITETREPARRLAHLIVEGATELDQAMQRLHDKKLYPQVQERVVRIHDVEDKADDVLDEALRDLVAHREDIFDFIRWKEIYEVLEACTDRLEDASDVLQRVMIANA